MIAGSTVCFLSSVLPQKKTSWVLVRTCNKMQATSVKHKQHCQRSSKMNIIVQRQGDWARIPASDREVAATEVTHLCEPGKSGRLFLSCQTSPALHTTLWSPEKAKFAQWAWCGKCFSSKGVCCALCGHSSGLFSLLRTCQNLYKFPCGHLYCLRKDTVYISSLADCRGTGVCRTLQGYSPVSQLTLPNLTQKCHPMKAEVRNIPITEEIIVNT